MIRGLIKPPLGRRLNWAHPLTPFVRGFWTLREGSGVTAYDESPYGAHATLTNGPVWGLYRHGLGVLFDASDDSLLVLNSQAGDHPYTGIWDRLTLLVGCRPDSVSGATAQTYWASNWTLMDLREDAGATGSQVPFSFGLDSSKLRIGWSANYTTSGEYGRVNGLTTLTAGRYYVLGAVVDPADPRNASLFVDGARDDDGPQQVASSSSARNVGSGAATFRLGARTVDGGGLGDPFDGVIEWALILDTSLSDAEVAALSQDPWQLLAPASPAPARIQPPPVSAGADVAPITFTAESASLSVSGAANVPADLAPVTFTAHDATLQITGQALADVAPITFAAESASLSGSGNVNASADLAPITFTAHTAALQIPSSGPVPANRTPAPGSEYVPLAEAEYPALDWLESSPTDPIVSGSITLEINGGAVTPVITPLANGYHVAAPNTAQEYGDTVQVESYAETTGALNDTTTWTYTTELAGVATQGLLDGLVGLHIATLALLDAAVPPNEPVVTALIEGVVRGAGPDNTTQALLDGVISPATNILDFATAILHGTVTFFVSVPVGIGVLGGERHDTPAGPGVAARDASQTSVAGGLYVATTTTYPGEALGALVLLELNERVASPGLIGGQREDVSGALGAEIEGGASQGLIIVIAPAGEYEDEV